MKTSVRILITLLAATVALVVLAPNYLRISEDSALSKFALNLGLDLQGGVSFQLQGDLNQAVINRLQAAATDVKKEFGFNYVIEGKEEIPRVRFKGKDSKLAKFVEKKFWDLSIAESEEHSVLAFKTNAKTEMQKRLLEQSVEVVRNRVDILGVAEPLVATAGSDRIVVELPGVQDLQKTKDLLQMASNLSFHFMEEVRDEQLFQTAIQLWETKDPEIDDKLAEFVPEGWMVRFEERDGVSPALVERDAYIVGSNIVDAFVSMNEDNRPIVSLELDSRGADSFEKMTDTPNRNRLIAVLLDGKISSTMQVGQKVIGRHVAIEFTGNQSYQQMIDEAKYISVALRSGSLPLKLTVIQEMKVGPTLGADSIEASRRAILIGFAAVAVFMVLWYGTLGMVANISLGLNLIFIFSILASLGAVLTLPGLAGVALTVGMAVDANVLIFERIIEEFRQHKTIDAAIEGGFQRSWAPIIDSALTTALTAIVLIFFASGPVRGFAVTLLVGLVTSIFCAVFAARAIIDLGKGWIRIRV